MGANRILLVDDDRELADMLAEYLRLEGFEVAQAFDGEAGVASARSGHHDLLVLDVMMPRMSGVDALREIRGFSSVPVLMLTARGDDVDRILGLELGADDYVAKPCTPRELVARIRAILRRVQGGATQPVESGELTVGRLQLWPQQRRATWQGSELELTSTEFNLLETLAREAGKVVSRDALSETALGRPLARFDRAIDVHFSSIRHKLGLLPNGRSPIETVRGMGYMLVRGE